MMLVILLFGYDLPSVVAVSNSLIRLNRRTRSPVAAGLSRKGSSSSSKLRDYFLLRTLNISQLHCNLFGREQAPYLREKSRQFSCEVGTVRGGGGKIQQFLADDVVDEPESCLMVGNKSGKRISNCAPAIGQCEQQVRDS
jgi:hypothetical protein